MASGLRAVKMLLFGRGNRIGRRLIVLIVAFSSLITLCISIVQLALEYRNLRYDLDRQLDGIAIYLPTIEGSVWDFEEEQIQRTLDALVLLPDVARARITASDTIKQWSAGRNISADLVTRTYPLRHEDRGRVAQIGVLEVVASLDPIYRQVAASAISIVLSNGLKTLLVVLFMVYLIRWRLTIRLERMAQKVRDLIPGIGPLRQDGEGALPSIPETLDELDAIDWTLDRVRSMKAAVEKELDSHHRQLEDLVVQRTAELTAAKLEAERANNAKSRFLAAASHDLRQPLSALSLYVGVLANKASAADGQLLANMGDCVANLNEMLFDLLDLSKLDAGVVTPNIDDFALDAILVKVVSSHAPEARSKGLVLRCGNFGLIGRTDPVLFQRVVGNLVSNAIRYTRRGGVAIVCRRRQGKSWVEVWDTGIGIPADQIVEIFEEFKQLGNHERNRVKGSGLGLAIVAKTAALLGLQIRVQSRPGKGSMFAVELPFGEIVRPVVQRQYSHRPLRIALVDDNSAVAAALAYALTQVGHQVVSAASRAELLPLLDGISPDIVVSDYRLAEGEDGIDVIDSLRAAFGINLPAIIVTGDTDPKIIRRLTEEGISVLHKPLDLDVLRARIAELTA